MNRSSDKAAIFWNMTGSIISAAASFLLLLFVTRTAGVKEGGIFSLAYTTAQILLTVGKFGVRSYQATDIRNEISFPVYFATRIVFCLLMMLLDIAYILFNHYETESALVFVFVCLMKTADALEDVYHGQMQKLGFLALAGRLLAVRNAVTILLFGILMFAGSNLWKTSAVTAVISLALCLFLNEFYWKKLSQVQSVTSKNGRMQSPKNKSFTMETNSKETAGRETIMLLKNCFPLFIGTFLSLVIYNVPKYVIGIYGSAEEVAYFTILFMPTFVINLFSDFIFKPMLTEMAYDWENRRYEIFLQRIHRMLCLIASLLLLAVVAAYFLGTPILGWLYQVDIQSMRPELCILMIGGGFSAAVYLFYNVLTCMREQTVVLVCYVLALAGIIVCSCLLIVPYGLPGQTIVYLMTEAFLCFLMYGSIRFAIQRNKAQRK